jgi:hypothetical protein
MKILTKCKKIIEEAAIEEQLGFHWTVLTVTVAQLIYKHREFGKDMVFMRSWSSSVSIVSDYGLDDQAIGVQSLAGAKYFSSNLCVQTGSEAHPASCTMGTGGPFPVTNTAGTGH